MSTQKHGQEPAARPEGRALHLNRVGDGLQTVPPIAATPDGRTCTRSGQATNAGRCAPLIVVWLLALLLTPPMMLAAVQAPAAPPANADEGRKLFVSYGCYQCHGYEGQGSSATGPRLGPRPLPLASFSRYVRRPTGQMPPYTTKVASDSDLAKIHAFLEARPAPPAVDTIPQLK